MVTTCYLFYGILTSQVYEQKNIILGGTLFCILGGVFLGLAIYSYFYRKLDKRERFLDKIIIKADYYLQIINEMSEKSEVKEILNAVAAFNNSINGFKDNIIETVRDDIEKSEKRVVSHIDKEIKRTNDKVDKVEADVNALKKNAGEEKIELRIQKNKLAWTLTIGMVVFGVINAAVIYFMIKGLS